MARILQVIYGLKNLVFNGTSFAGIYEINKKNIFKKVVDKDQGKD